MKEKVYDIHSQYMPWVRFDKGMVWDDDLESAPGSSVEWSPPFLVPSPNAISSSYNPLAELSLWKDFCTLEPEKDWIIEEFANDYGWLNGYFMVIDRKNTDHGKIPVIKAEPFEYWVKEIQNAQFVEFMAEAIASGDEGTLQEIIEWRRNGNGFLMIRRNPACLETIRSVCGDYGTCSVNSELNQKSELIHNPDTVSLFQEGEVLGPARLFLGRIIGQQLDEHEVKPRLLFDNEKKQLNGYLIPKTLIGAIWLSCYLETIGESVLKRCQFCGKLDSIGDGHLIEGRGKHLGKYHHKKCFAKIRQREHRSKIDKK
jgi:hypothetical protein